MASIRCGSVGVDVVLCNVMQDRERVVGRDREVRWDHTRKNGTCGPSRLETIGRRGLRSTIGDGWCWRCMRMLGFNESDMNGPNEFADARLRIQ
jgi:hypothetical protein